MSRTVYIVSAEPSGDLLSVDLIRDLRQLDPNIAILAIGGDAVRREGFYSVLDPSPLAVVGFVEGLRVLREVTHLADMAASHIMLTEPDAVVLVDSWGFSIRIAKQLRQRAFKGTIIKYVAPQVWAMRRGRAGVLSRHVDLLMTLYPFDVPYFRAEGLRAVCVGNPVLETDYATGDGPALRARHGIDPTDPVLCVAFGSRPGEIARMTQPFLDTVAELRRRYPRLAVVAPTVSDIEAELRSRLLFGNDAGKSIIQVPESEKLDAFAAADFALATSGTVTTQLADAGVPTVVAYKVAPLTYRLAKWLFKADYISIVNVVAKAPLMPEFIQDGVDPVAMADWLDGCLQHPTASKKLQAALRAATDSMRITGGEDDRHAARLVLQAIDTHNAAAKRAAANVMPWLN